MQLLDGRKVAQALLSELKEELAVLGQKHIHPKLVIILVGKNLASLSYIKQKSKACDKIGLACDLIEYDESITTEELIAKIDELNKDESVHGVLVQLPLPKHIAAPQVIRAIDPKKDVDGFTAYNLGKTLIGSEFEDLPPCTPRGVIRMLDFYDIDVRGMDVTMVGASNIVGKPLAIMLLNRGATPTICHIDTKDLASHARRADLLLVAVGKPDLITADMVKDDVIVVDIGCNKVDGKLCGDVDFDKISKKASYITPVPGGAGPMTVACLLENTIHAAKRIHNLIP